MLEVASPETQFALDSSFNNAYWGIGGFGGALFNAEGELSSDLSGFEAWLTWLQNAQEQPGIELDADQDALRQRFLDGDSTYLATGSSALDTMRQALGENVRVIPLPNGPEGLASPLLSVDSFMFSDATSEDQTELALKFAKFAASASNQKLLAQEFNLVPTNRLIAETTEDPAIGVAVQQASEKAVILPTSVDPNLLEALNEVYRLVLVDGVEPADAVARLLGTPASQ
jgi:ABC-type glycerol-3-phosphate transport system substrate-binding protein